MKFSKRGTVESYFLITIILAIAGFLIALYFLINSSPETGNEACKLSVLSRATTPAGTKNYIPLKCYTTKYCLTKNMFGKCEEFAGEKNVERIQLPSNPELAAQKIEEINANAKYDCWEMMGQGKLDIVGNFQQYLGLSEKQFEPVCVICSRIAIDKTSFSDSCKKENYAKSDEEKEKCIKELNKTLFLVDINNYMETHLVPESSLTYAQTFSNKAFAKLPAAENIDQKNEIKNDKILTEDKKNYIESNFKSLDNSSTNLEKAYVFSQVKVTGGLETVSRIGELGGTIAYGASTTPILNKLLLHPYVLIPGLVVAVSTAGYAYYNAEKGVEAAATYCGDFESSVVDPNGKTPEGCTLIQSVPYNHRYVNSMCSAIEGNP